MKTLLCVFYAILIGVGLSCLLFVLDGNSDLVHEKWSMVLFMITDLALVILMDIIAFKRGAIATISQVILHWQDNAKWVVPLIFGAACILAGHFTVAHVPGTPFNVGAITRWSLFYSVEALLTLWLGATIFAQAPDRD